MKSIYLTLLAAALALPAMAQIEEGQEYTDNQGIVYTYGTDDWDWDDTSLHPVWPVQSPGACIFPRSYFFLSVLCFYAPHSE